MIAAIVPAHTGSASVIPARTVRGRRALQVGLIAILGLFVALPAAEAQGPKRIPRLCFLTFDPGTLRSRSPRFDAFFQELETLGYVDGRNLDIRYLSADNVGGRFPALIEECLSSNPDVIAVTTKPAAQLLKKATRTVPIVMVALGTGLVDSVSKPNENITGMSLMVPEMAVKRLELLKEVLPGIKRVLVLSYLADPIAPRQVKAMERAAPSLGLSLYVQDIRAPEDIPAAFSAAANARAEGVVITEESMFVVHRAQVTELAARYKMPAVYPFLLPVTDANGLLAFAAKASELHRSAAGYVDRILKGAKPSELPVQQPTQFELVINLNVAKALALTVPPTVLARATEVIE